MSARTSLPPSRRARAATEAEATRRRSQRNLAPPGASWDSAGGPIRQDQGAEEKARAYEKRFASRYAEAPGPTAEADRSGRLPLAERRRHEAELGTDLDHLRLRRNDAPRRMGAEAMAEGAEVTLAPDAPRSGKGLRRLIAHEVAHAAGPAGPAGGAPVAQMSPREGAQAQVPAPLSVTTEMGTSVTVYFGQGSFLLGGGGMEALARLRDRLRFMPGAVIHIDGYASAEGTEAFNMELSENRRMAVRALLFAGLPARPDIGGRAHGEARSAEEGVAAEDRAAFRARNRRVEITVLQPLRLATGGGAGTEAGTEPGGPRLFPPRLPVRPETDEERLNRILSTPPPRLEREKINLCGRWKDSTRTFFDRRLRRLGVGETARGILTDLGVGAVQKLPFTAIEQGLKAGNVGEDEKKAVMKAVEAACKQEWTP